jgi:hypothetical protein
MAGRMWNATLSWRCAPWRKLKAELTAGQSINWSGPRGVAPAAIMPGALKAWLASQ